MIGDKRLRQSRRVPSLDKLPSVIHTLIKAGQARYAGAEPRTGCHVGVVSAYEKACTGKDFHFLTTLGPRKPGQVSTNPEC